MNGTLKDLTVLAVGRGGGIARVVPARRCTSTAAKG
jgi:hypothetical protein